jgi:hypothetical protein
MSTQRTLFRCSLDGSGCAYSDISAGHRPESFATALVDATGGRLLVFDAMFLGTTQTHPAIEQCNLDGTACGYTDLFVGTGATIQGRSQGLLWNGRVIDVVVDSVTGVPSILTQCP